MRKKRWLVFGAFLILSFAVYRRVLFSYFISDDWCLIPAVLKSSIFGTWQYGGYFYRPLTLLTFLLQGRIWGMSPGAFHAFNIALHGINSFLVFLLSLQLLQEFSPGNPRCWITALLSGFLFLILPSHSEPVSWIAARPDLLATSFSLLSLIGFLPQLKSYSVKWKSAFASLLFFLLAMFSKESALVLPFLAVAILLASSLHEGKAPTRSALVYCTLLIVLIICYLGSRWLILGSLVSGYGPTVHLNFSFAVIAKMVVTSLLRAFLPPFPNRLDPMLRPVMLQCVTAVAIVGILLALYGLSKIVKEKFRAPISFAYLLIFLFLIALLPVTNLGMSLFSSDGERLLYLPSVFTCILISHIFMNLIRNTQWRFIAIAVVLTFYVTTLSLSIENWRTAGEIFLRAQTKIKELGPQPSIVILNVPDSFRGAFVFRTYFGCTSTQHPNLEVLSFHTYHSMKNRIQLIPQSNREFEVKLYDDFDEFNFVVADHGCMRIWERSKKDVRFRLDCLPKPVVLLFTEGNLIDVSKMVAVPASSSFRQ